MDNQQRPRSVNNVNIDIYTSLGRREMKSIFKIDFNTDTKIVLYSSVEAF